MAYMDSIAITNMLAIEAFQYMYKRVRARMFIDRLTFPLLTIVIALGLKKPVSTRSYTQLHSHAAMSTVSPSRSSIFDRRWHIESLVERCCTFLAGRPKTLPRGTHCLPLLDLSQHVKQTGVKYRQRIFDVMCDMCV